VELKLYPVLFGGGLGLLRIKPVHLTLRENAKPVHARVFPIPQALMKPTKKINERSYFMSYRVTRWE
jgi:hypothetical protein